MSMVNADSTYEVLAMLQKYNKNRGFRCEIRTKTAALRRPFELCTGVRRRVPH